MSRELWERVLHNYQIGTIHPEEAIGLMQKEVTNLQGDLAQKAVEIAVLEADIKRICDNHEIVLKNQKGVGGTPSMIQCEMAITNAAVDGMLEKYGWAQIDYWIRKSPTYKKRLQELLVQHEQTERSS